MIIKGEELKVPNAGGKDLQYLNLLSKEKELWATGIWNERIFPYNVTKEVLPTLQSLNFGDYDPSFWSCHEMALWGIAHIRYNHPGCRTAIALGTRSPNEAHSLIVLWDGAGNDWVFYDSAGKQGNQILLDNSFEATKIVNFPPPGIGSDASSVPGFGGFQISDTGFLVLNPTYSTDKKPEVMKDLDDLSNRIKSKECFSAPPGVNQDFFKGMFLLHDRVLLECMRIRNKYKQFPIGMAFGKATFKKGELAGKTSEYATLILWDGPNNPPILWGLVAKDLKNESGLAFVPRVVIV